MVGITNAVLSSGIKHITGNFTASSSSQQTSFNVTGVGFDAKVIAVNITSYTSNSANDADIIKTLFIDLVNNVAYYSVASTTALLPTSVGNGGSASQSGTTLTVNAPSSYPFSKYQTSGASQKGYGTYTYHIYG